MPFDSFDEFNDPDATSCALGDYNAFEDREVFNDGEGREDFGDFDDFDDEPDDRWSD